MGVELGQHETVQAHFDARKLSFHLGTYESATTGAVGCERRVIGPNLG
jgi:hypothetical protein